MGIFFRSLFAVGMAFVLSSPCMAQGSAYELARPGYATHTVYIWGAVGSPGIWKVEQDVDLVELLSAARVPGVGVDQRGLRQHFMLRIYREQGGQRSEIYSERLERILVGSRNYPALQDGDILAVESRQRPALTFQGVVQYIGSVSSLLLLVLRIGRFI